MKRLTVFLLLPLVLAGTAGLYFANVKLGDLNQDEGWYLYAASRIFDGKLPYRDFAFTQGPALPLIYSIAYPVVEKWGIEGGRWITVFFGLCATLLASLTAIRITPRGARCGVFLLVWVFLGINVYHSYYTSIVKTYALCAVSLAAGLYFLAYASTRWGRQFALLAGLAFALSAGTRITAGAALAVGGLVLLLGRRHFHPGAWIFFGVGGGAGLLFLWLPFLIAGPDGFIFGMFRYHTMRSPAEDGFALAAYKAGFLARFVQAYFIPFLAGLGLLFYRLMHRPAGPRLSEPGGAASLVHLAAWSVAILVTLVHFTAPFPYDDYQVVVAPLFAIALAASIAGSVVRYNAIPLTPAPAKPDDILPAGSPKVLLQPTSGWMLVLLTLASFAAAGTSSINQDWFIYGRDRIWWPVKEKSPLTVLQETADRVRELCGGSKVLLTQDTYLAVEAGLEVPPGFEMGPFSYYPQLDDAAAANLQVLNRNLLLNAITSGVCRVAAVSGYGLTIASPDVKELESSEQAELNRALLGRYRVLETVPRFGQAHTPLRILVLKDFPKKEKRKKSAKPSGDHVVEPVVAVEPALTNSSSEIMIQLPAETNAPASVPVILPSTSPETAPDPVSSESTH